jgi:hypothetical protein
MDSRKCQTVGVPRQSRGLTISWLLPLFSLVCLRGRSVARAMVGCLPFLGPVFYSLAARHLLRLAWRWFVASFGPGAKFVSTQRPIQGAHPLVYRLIREIFVPSMLTPAINPCWLKMNA